jgi:hypothetical protein
MLPEMIGECFYGVEIDNWSFGGEYYYMKCFMVNGLLKNI